MKYWGFLNQFTPKISLVSLVLLGAFLTIQIGSPAKVNAAYEHGRLIDNSLFLDAQSMSGPEVQSFLVSKGSGLANMSFLIDCDLAGAQAKQIYLSLGAPCGQYGSAASIIYYAGQVYGLNPKVIMATMQKEQSVITAPNPTSWQTNQAMGYNCPTSGECESTSGFFYQIDNGTWVLRFHYERARGNNDWWYTSGWTCGSGKPSYYMPNLYPGQNVNFIDPYSGIQYATVYIQNAATSAFYCYTPHVFNNHTNSPHPNEPKGSSRCYSSHPLSGDRGRCYTGSYNFVYFFELWFGPTTRNLITSNGNAVYLVENGLKRVIPDVPTFLSYSYKWSEVVTISATEMSQIPDGAVVPYNVHYRDGKFVRVSDGVYLVENGLKRAIPDGITLLSYSYRWSDVVVISDVEMAKIPDGAVVPYYTRFREGKLISSDGNAVYLVEDGLRRAVPDGPTFSSYSYRWSDVVMISDTEMSKIPVGTPLPKKT